MKLELTILLPEEITMIEVEKLEKLIKRYAKITSKEVSGVKRLAYPIYNRERALYIYYDIDMPSNEVSSLANKLNINDNILRYLLVKAD